MSSEGQADSPILVSYAGPDFMWAEWISEQLQRAGCAVDALESSGGPTTDLAETLRQAADGYRHCIAVLSSNYIRTAVPTPEAGETAAAWAAEHPGVLIPVLVRRCELPARFWPLSPADLREVSDDRTAARRLLSRVLGSRAPAPEAIFEPMTRFPGRRPAVWSPDLPARNPFFTGRDEMLRNLRRHLTTDVTALVPHSLQGLAGIGKTQLAVEYAYRFAADYDVVWWIPAGKQATARRALADLAVRLDLGGPQTEISELIGAAQDALRTGQPYQRWLLIFDNAGRPTSIQSLIQSLVPSGHGDVLITSRDQTWDRHADALNVDVYDRPESIEFLRRRSPGLSASDADRLAAELGDMPLALEHAAGWLSATGMVLDDYLSLLSKHTSEVLSTGRFPNYEASVAVTWTISMNQLREVSPAAIQLLNLCAFVGPDPVPLDLFISAPEGALPAGLHDALRSASQRAEILQAVRSYSLARVSQGSAREPTLQQHRLVQAVARELIPADQQAAYREFAHKLLTTADPGDPRAPANWPIYDMLLPHVISSGALADPDPAVRALVCHEAHMLNLRGEYQSSLDISVTALGAWSARLDEIDHDLILIRREQGSALRGLGRFAEALAVQRASYDLSLRRLGPDHPDTLVTIGGFAANLRRLGNFMAARELDRHAVEVLTRERGRDDAETLRHAHNLAVDHRLAGEFMAALEINRHGADVLARILGPDAFSTLYAVNDTARDLRELGRYYESLSMQEQTYVRYREVFGPDSPDTLRAMKNLAVSRRKAGRYEEAADLAADVLDRHRHKFGDTHVETLAATTNFANDHRCLGRYAEGQGYAEIALRGFREVLGEDHPYAAGAAVNLAALMRSTGDAGGARALNEQALQQLRAVFGPNHRYTLSCAVNLASDLAELGDLEAAREIGERSLAALRESSGEDHPYTLSGAVNLALDLRALGEREAFHELFTDAIDRYHRTLGNAHPEAVEAAARKRAVCDIEPPPV
jgi:tetratricopeptide (TPR) repeat protein